MTKIFKYFIKVRKDLLILLGLALITYVAIEFWLVDYQELFKGANKWGQFASKLSISYISAFIFYFIVVHIKSEKDKENINEYVGIRVQDILTSGELFIQPFMQVKDKKARYEDLKMNELRGLLTSINRYAKDSPLSDGQNTQSWIDWWEYLKDGINESIKEVFNRYNHIDTELIKILTRMENSVFFTQWELLSFPHDKTFGIYTEQTRMFLKHLNDLKKYSEKNLSQYKTTSAFMGFETLEERKGKKRRIEKLPI